MFLKINKCVIINLILKHYINYINYNIILYNIKYKIYE